MSYQSVKAPTNLCLGVNVYIKSIYLSLTHRVNMFFGLQSLLLAGIQAWSTNQKEPACRESGSPEPEGFLLRAQGLTTELAEVTEKAI